MNFTDQLGRELKLLQTPRRVVSLVPSITELVLDLGLGERLVGRTKFCIHPEEVVSHIQIIGGTKNIRLDRVKELNPDLILANKEENVEFQVSELAKEFPVYVSNVKGEDSALQMISHLGTILELEALDLINEITQASEAFKIQKQQLGSAVYIIWNKPMMAAGADTFIHQMLEAAGFRNAIKSLRYPVLTKETLSELDPDYILLSSEPFPFKEEHVHAFKKDYPNAKILLVDGEMFSWYGSKMTKSYNYFLESFY